MNTQHRAGIWGTVLVGSFWAASVAAQNPITPPEKPSVRISPIHFRPKAGSAGDTIAFYWHGQYHLFYLNSLRQWGHNVSTDLIHWTELPPAVVPCDDPLGPDWCCWTGSVVERGGRFYLFYTGQNPRDPKNDQKVMLATSKDLIHWEKQPDRTFYPDGKIYWNRSINGPAANLIYHHQAFRDPDVFWSEREQEWWMILHALAVDGMKPCIGCYSSKDLTHWTPRPPLATYSTGLSLECPHAAPMQGRWFVLAADTSYVSAETPAGPYPPDMKNYDSGDLFVPKSLFDGKRRLVWGWVRDLEGNRDSGKNLWGGTLCLPREIYPGPAGLLYCRPAAEATAAFTRTALTLASSPRPGGTVGTWQYEDGKLGCGPAGGACDFSVPDDYMLQSSIQLESAATLTVIMRRQQEGTGYPLVINPKNQTASISRAQFHFGRTIELDAAKPITVQAFVQGTIIECFINNQFSFTCRTYDYSKGGLRLNVEGGGVRVLDLEVKTLAP
jgi:beta-fructofuranosidase